MAILQKNYYAFARASVSPGDIHFGGDFILTGNINGTLVKRLTLHNTNDADSVFYIQRCTPDCKPYQSVKVFLPPKSRRVLWDDFHVVNPGHDLFMLSGSHAFVHAVAETCEEVDQDSPNGWLMAGMLFLDPNDMPEEYAGWRPYGTETWRGNGEMIALPPGDDYRIEFKDASVYGVPKPGDVTNVKVKAGELTKVYGTYAGEA